MGCIIQSRRTSQGKENLSPKQGEIRMDYETLKNVLNENQGKNFVRRILNPEAYPVMDLVKGEIATHQMEYSEAGPNKFIVYPRIAYENKELKNYGDDAFDRALKSKDYISFDNEADAEYFSKNYKEYWDKEKKVLPSVGGE
jgi:hypothetical protein